MSCISIFFFQAEDGIRYWSVTGVQTCALPISMKTGTGATWHLGYHANYIGVGPWPDPSIAFCVRITHEPSSGRVTRAARQVLADLLDRIARTSCALSSPYPSPPLPTPSSHIHRLTLTVSP